MPYKRLKGKRRTRRRYAKKSMVAVAKKVAKREIAKNTEVKWYDIVYGKTGVDSAGTIQYLTKVPQGDTDNNRNGDKLTPKWLKMRLNFTIAPATDTTNQVRFMIFRWKPNTSLSPPVLDNLFQNFSLTVNTLVTLLPYTWDMRNQFTVLYDRVFQLNEAQSLQIDKKIFLRLASKKVAFTGATTDGADHICFATFSDSNAAPNPQITVYNRLAYVDS